MTKLRTVACVAVTHVVLFQFALVERARQARDSEQGEVSEKALLIGIFITLGLGLGAFVTAWAWEKVRGSLN